MKKQILTLLLLVLSLMPVLARPDDGILGDFQGRTAAFSVRSVIQQDNGLIWFGTDRRLYSFDGYDLTPYPCPDGHIYINKLLMLPDRLLVGTNSGLYEFLFKSKSYRRLTPFDNQIIRALQSCGAFVYAGTNSGLYRYDPASDTAVQLLENVVFSLAGKEDSLYLGMADGVSVLDTATGSITPFARHTGICISILPEESRIWIGTPSLLLCADAGSGEILSHTPFVVPKVLCRGEGALLVGTDNGLYRFDLEDGSSTQLRSSITWDGIEDRNRDLWFGTSDGLLHWQRSSVIQPLPNLQTEPLSHYPSLSCDRRGRIWLGGSNGLTLIGRDGNSRRYTMTGSSYRIPHNRVYRIVGDPESADLFFATDGGILRYQQDADKMIPIRIPDSRNWVYDLLPEKGEIWAASFEGIYRLDRNGSVLRHYGQADGLSSNDIVRLVHGKDERIWALTRDQHLFRIDPLKEEIREIPTDIPLPYELCADREGRIWIVRDNRIARITPGFDGSSEQTVLTFHPDKKLEVFAMTDAADRIWVSSSNGLFGIHKESLEINQLETYRQYVGIGYDTVGRNLLLGAVGSADILRLDEFVRNLHSEKNAVISFTGMLVNGTQHIGPEELKAGELTLSSRQNFLEISFSDFNYADETPHRFEYRLENRRSVWQGTVVGNKLALTALQPGRYTLRVVAADSRSQPEEVLTFRIRQPIALSPAMLALYLCLLGLGICGLVRFILMRRNLRQERLQRDELIARSRQKEAFFQDVAHEFKTPLSLIIGPIGKMIREAGPDTDLENLRLAQENATKLSTLIHRTIDLSKDSDGVADNLLNTDVEMVDFARGIFDFYRENFPKHEFIFTSSHPKIPVVADIVKIEIVLNNLLSNACKYTPEGGSVLLTLERDDVGRQLVIKVSDTGIGFPKEELPFAFQRYFVSSRTKGGDYKSTGIGLSVTRKYVELHGGSVSVDSDADGTTFTVLLPCLAPYVQDTARSAGQSADDETDKPLIAIVDDNAQICSFIESILRERYRCVCSHNGKSGLKLCKDVLPDLIISDVRMPIMDGLEMCGQLRKFAPLNSAPIILLTAKDDKQTERQSIDLNIDVFLPKPFDLSTLTARVDQLLGNKKRMEQKLRMEMLASPTAARELSSDEKYLKKVTSLIEEHLDDSDLSVGKLCELGNFNEKQLYRKLKQFTGLSTVKYIHSIRLKKSAQLLQSGNFTVSEVMYSVGFSNASYFTRTFSSVYKMTPSDYMKSFKDKQI